MQTFHSAQIVVLNTIATLDQPELLSQHGEGSIRQPAMCQSQLDPIVRDRTWSAKIGNESNLTTDEVRYSPYLLYNTVLSGLNLWNSGTSLEWHVISVDTSPSFTISTETA